MVKDDDLEKLGRMLSRAVDEGFTGSIQINMFKGSISNVVKQQSFKLSDFIALDTRS